MLRLYGIESITWFELRVCVGIMLLMGVLLILMVAYFRRRGWL